MQTNAKKPRCWYALWSSEVTSLSPAVSSFCFDLSSRIFSDEHILSKIYSKWTTLSIAPFKLSWKKNFVYLGEKLCECWLIKNNLASAGWSKRMIGYSGQSREHFSVEPNLKSCFIRWSLLTVVAIFYPNLTNVITFELADVY